MWTWVAPFDGAPDAEPDLATLGARRLYLCMYYEGPWARLCHRAWKFTPAWSEAIERGEEEPPDMPDVGPVRDWLGHTFLKLDHRWREFYAHADIEPNPRWKVGGPR